jgi:hypothetical protein
MLYNYIRLACREYNMTSVQRGRVYTVTIKAQCVNSADWVPNGTLVYDIKPGIQHKTKTKIE